MALVIEHARRATISEIKEDQIVVSTIPVPEMSYRGNEKVIIEDPLLSNFKEECGVPHLSRAVTVVLLVEAAGPKAVALYAPQVSPRTDLKNYAGDDSAEARKMTNHGE